MKQLVYSNITHDEERRYKSSINRSINRSACGRKPIYIFTSTPPHNFIPPIFMGLYNGFSVEQCEHTIRQQSTKGICDDALQFCQLLNFSYHKFVCSVGSLSPPHSDSVWFAVGSVIIGYRCHYNLEVWRNCSSCQDYFRIIGTLQMYTYAFTFWQILILHFFKANVCKRHPEDLNLDM